MSTRVRRRGVGDELEPFSKKELEWRPEVRYINKYALVRAYIRIGLKGVSSLALLWATVVLLGGFVSDLRSIDFWCLTIIVFLLAAGLFDAMGDTRFMYFGGWATSLIRNITSWGEKNHDECQLRTEHPVKRQIHILQKITDITLFVVFYPVMYFAVDGPVVCVLLSMSRLVQQDYGIADGDASKANLKPALNLFYRLSLAHGAISFLCPIIELIAQARIVKYLSQQHGLNPEVLRGYLDETKKMCLDNLVCTENWNLTTYGADLLDSQVPEDYTSGGRVLTMLIDQDMSLSVRRLLIRSPRQRIQKLIGTLAWRSPAEREMRWLAARIVEQLAGHLNLAHFPGALECISSLFDTSCHNNGDQEALHLPFEIEHSKKGKRTFRNKVFGDCFPELICHRAAENGDTLNQGESGEDLLLPSLRILENLAHDRHNSRLIYDTKDLLSKILAPVSSNEFVQDVESNTAWTKVVDGSLKVVSQLMGSSGSTGKEMRSLIANDSNAIKNLVTVLDMKCNSGMIELQMRAMEVLTELALHHPASTSAETLIKKALDIFLTADWMKNYLTDEKTKTDKPTTNQQNTVSRSRRKCMGTCMNDFVNKVNGAKTREKERVEKKMKEAKETASWLKEKAGEALALLSGDSEAINSFTACTEDDVRRLTDLLDSSIKTIKCEIGETEPVEIDVTIGCRISAAVILKHLSNYDKEDKIRKQGTLRTVLAELLPVQASSKCWERLLDICCCKSDKENPSVGRGGCKQSNSASQSHHIQQCGERRLQAELISLVAAIRRTNNREFAEVLLSQPQPVALEDFVVRLEKMVKDNMYATPACLAIQKQACEMVTGFLKSDQNVEVIAKHSIIDTLLDASKAMSGLESSMLFAGIDRDCHGVPLKPLSSVLASVLAKDAEDLLRSFGRKETSCGHPPANA